MLMENYTTTNTACADKFEPITSDLQNLVSIVNGHEPFGFGIVGTGTIVTEDQIEKVAQHIRNYDMRAEQIIGSLARRYKLRFLSSAACWMAEAWKVEGYIQKLMSDGGVAIATNTSEEQAWNAAVVRFLTSHLTDGQMEKTDVSRTATALAGLQILCADNNVCPSFGTFSDVFALASTSSRDKLISLARERRKVDEQVSKRGPLNEARKDTADAAPGSLDAAELVTSVQQTGTAPVFRGVVAERHDGSFLVSAAEARSEGDRQPVLILDVPECLNGDQFIFEGRIINGQLHLFLVVSSTDR